MGFTLPQITSSRLSNRGCRAAPVRSRPSRPGRMAAKPAHPASALSFPFCRSTSPVLRMSSTDFASQIWMPGPFSRMGSPGSAVTVGSPLCSAMMAATSEFRTGSKGSCPNTLWATGIPSMSCCPCSVVRFIWGKAGTKNSCPSGLSSATASSSAPMLPRSAESVFL